MSYSITIRTAITIIFVILIFWFANRQEKIASLEAIAFSFVYGIEIMKNDGTEIKVIRAGNDNLFRSNIFLALSGLINQDIDLPPGTSVGAARASGLVDGDLIYHNLISQNNHVKTYKPNKNNQEYT